MRKSFTFHVDALRLETLDEFNSKLTQFLADWEATGLVLVLTPEMVASTGSPGRTKTGNLTERESRVWELLARGMSNKLVGHNMGISEGTVKVHTTSLFKKLGVRTRIEAALKYTPEKLKEPADV